jgi:sulfatase maturation enzyme AslB (radical SAM superfamily)
MTMITEMKKKMTEMFIDRSMLRPCNNRCNLFCYLCYQPERSEEVR